MSKLVSSSAGYTAPPTRAVRRGACVSRVPSAAAHRSAGIHRRGCGRSDPHRTEAAAGEIAGRKATPDTSPSPGLFLVEWLPNDEQDRTQRSLSVRQRPEI